MNNIIAYIWVSHGTNISTVHNYYPVKNPFQYISFYSKPNEAITPNLLQSFNTDVCGLLLGTCPMLSITNNVTNQKVVYLPPLIFYSVSPESEVIKKLTGLYRFIINVKNSMNISHNCNFQSQTIILNHNDMINKFGNNTPITYSNIFDVIQYDCNQNSINYNDVVVGIYSCQSKLNPNTINNLHPLQQLPKTINNFILPAKIYDDKIIVPQINNIISPAIISFAQFNKQWKPLAHVNSQGCGLNTLTYYNIIDQSSASEQVVCSVSELTIYELIDHLNNYYKLNNIHYMGYLIARLQFTLAIEVLMHLLNGIQTQTNTLGVAIIFKIYPEINNDNKYLNKISEKIVSIGKLGNEINYIDPLSEIHYLINNTNTPLQISKEINAQYKKLNLSVISYCDIIFTVNNTILQNNIPADTFQNLKNAVEYRSGTFLQRLNTPPHFGGKNNIIKNFKLKKNKTKHKKTKHNKNKYKHNKTIVQKNIQKGGEFDNFEKTMMDLDKQHNIQTILLTTV